MLKLLLFHAVQCVRLPTTGVGRAQWSSAVLSDGLDLDLDLIPITRYVADKIGF